MLVIAAEAASGLRPPERGAADRRPGADARRRAHRPGLRGHAAIARSGRRTRPSRCRPRRRSSRPTGPPIPATATRRPRTRVAAEDDVLHLHPGPLPDDPGPVGPDASPTSRPCGPPGSSRRRPTPPTSSAPGSGRSRPATSRPRPWPSASSSGCRRRSRPRCSTSSRETGDPGLQLVRGDALPGGRPRDRRDAVLRRGDGRQPGAARTRPQSPDQARPAGVRPGDAPPDTISSVQHDPHPREPCLPLNAPSSSSSPTASSASSSAASSPATRSAGSSSSGSSSSRSTARSPSGTTPPTARSRSSRGLVDFIVVGAARRRSPSRARTRSPSSARSTARRGRTRPRRARSAATSRSRPRRTSSTRRTAPRPRPPSSRCGSTPAELLDYERDVDRWVLAPEE